MKNWTKYGQKVASEITRNNTNTELIKAVKSASTMKMKSMNCKTGTLIDKLIWFGKPKHKKIVRGKVREEMNVQPTIGAKPNLYCEAIELVCGGSPKICVLVERKSRLRVK